MLGKHIESLGKMLGTRWEQIANNQNSKNSTLKNYLLNYHLFWKHEGTIYETTSPGIV
jgi:hypothetical protein